MNSFFIFARCIVTSEYLSLVLRIFIGIVMIKSSIWKIFSPAEFFANVASFQIAPFVFVNLVTVVLPSVELICGIFLIIGLRTKAAASIIGLNLTVFAILIAINLFRGAPISCGCFAPAGEPISWGKVLTNIGEVIITVQIFFFDRIILLRRGGFQFFNR